VFLRRCCFLKAAPIPATRGDSFRAKLEKIQVLRKSGESDELEVGLRKGLEDRNTYVVAKAATVAGERNVIALIPDLLERYERLFDHPPAADPLAQGKQAIAQALKDLGHADPAVFLRGLHHVQLEPVYGGAVDVAAELRGICAHALVACDIESFTLLEEFVDGLADPCKSVRAEIVRAIGEMGGDGILLLRLKALCSDPEEEVVGECFVALLHRQRAGAVPFVARFLGSARPAIQLEAVSALAASREREALEAVQRFWSTEISTTLRQAILISCGESPLTEAADFLLSIVSDYRIDLAASALSALGASRFRNSIHERAQRAATETGNRRIVAAFDDAFGAAQLERFQKPPKPKK
jgi:HEAT repeat protein